MELLEADLPLGMAWQINKKCRIDADVGLRVEAEFCNNCPGRLDVYAYPYGSIGLAVALGSP